jgi:hypothetical protein
VGKGDRQLFSGKRKKSNQSPSYAKKGRGSKKEMRTHEPACRPHGILGIGTIYHGAAFDRNEKK